MAGSLVALTGEFMRVAMIGTGYVGLVSGACFADFGHHVVCVDKDASRVALLERGEIPIYEPGLPELIHTNRRERRLSFRTDVTQAVRSAEAVFIAVGTPSRRGDGHADLSYVYAAAREIAAALSGPTVVITKSTVPIGTGDEIERIIRTARPDADVAVVSNPEFLREGAAIHDFKHPDRIVVGTNDERARQVMADLYRPLYLGATPMLNTDRRTAELIKYAANAFLATKITFINEIADLCERVGADIQDVSRGMGLDNRIGGKFLHAGPGFGGSCLPKDAVALMKTAEAHQTSLHLVETIVAVNDRRKRAMARKVAAALGGDLHGSTIAVLGLTFKPQTDDIREAPALSLIAALQEMGVTLRAYDPAGMEQARKLLPGIIYCEHAYSCAEGADALVIVTEWEQFRALDFRRLKQLMARPILVDLRNIYRPAEVERHGFVYVGVGRRFSAQATRDADIEVNPVADIR
jgi:UDPglucose 6-dehydrogenase